MLIFGIVLTTVGAILPSLAEKFGIDKIQAGSLLLLMTLGVLGGSILFGPFVDRFGYKGLLSICTAFIIAGLEGISYAPSFAVLRLSVFLFGLGGGALNGGTNALVSDISGERRGSRLSLLGVFFGIGALGIPLLMGILLRHFSYENIIAMVGITVLLPLLFFMTVTFPPPRHKEGFPLKEGLGLVRQRVLLLLAFILFFQSGLEITAGGWTTTYFEDELGVSPDRASLYLSLYWAGLMMNRLLLSKLLNRISPAVVFRTCLGIGLAAAVVLIVARNEAVAVMAIFSLGVGLAAGFPVILGYVGDTFPRMMGTAFSVAFTIALLGGMSLPYLTGVLGHFFTLRISLLIVPLSIVAMLAIFKYSLKQLGIVSIKRGG